jgi:hypothetical protein
MNEAVTGWLSLGEELQATPLLLALRVLPPLMMGMAMIELFTRRFYATGLVRRQPAAAVHLRRRQPLPHHHVSDDRLLCGAVRGQRGRQCQRWH